MDLLFTLTEVRKDVFFSVTDTVYSLTKACNIDITYNHVTNYTN